MTDPHINSIPSMAKAQSRSAVAALSCAVLCLGVLLMANHRAQAASDAAFVLAPVRAVAAPMVDTTTIAAESVTHPTHWVGSPPPSRIDEPATIVTWDIVQRVRFARRGGLYGP